MSLSKEDLKKIGDLVGATNKHLDSKIELIDARWEKRFSSLELYLNKRFGEIDARFDKIERKIDQLIKTEDEDIQVAFKEIKVLKSRLEKLESKVYKV